MKNSCFAGEPKREMECTGKAGKERFKMKRVDEEKKVKSKEQKRTREKKDKRKNKI